MLKEQNFEVHDDGLKDPFEEADEIKRTKEMRGAYRRDYLSVDDVDALFKDTGVEREMTRTLQSGKH